MRGATRATERRQTRAQLRHYDSERLCEKANGAGRASEAGSRSCVAERSYPSTCGASWAQLPSPAAHCTARSRSGGSRARIKSLRKIRSRQEGKRREYEQGRSLMIALTRPNKNSNNGNNGKRISGVPVRTHQSKTRQTAATRPSASSFLGPPRGWRPARARAAASNAATACRTKTWTWCAGSSAGVYTTKRAGNTPRATGSKSRKRKAGFRSGQCTVTDDVTRSASAVEAIRKQTTRCSNERQTDVLRGSSRIRRWRRGSVWVARMEFELLVSAGRRLH